MRSLLRVGAVPVDEVTFAGALEAIDDLVTSRRGGYVLTPNVDHVVLAEAEPALKAAYADAALSLADGMPILWASRLLGRPLPAKVSGSDLVAPLMARAASRGWSVYLLGGAPGVGEKAAAVLRDRLPALRIAGIDAPHIGAPDDAEAAAAAERIRAAHPDLVLVALGCPKQELWMKHQAARLGPSVALGIGASLDFVAGVVRRAPRWVSRLGLEWFYRLLHEPRRLWRRYLVRDPKFLGIVWRQLRARGRLGPGRPGTRQLPGGR